jgi:glutamate-1-semialdehyde 2,1-aminomutase
MHALRLAREFTGREKLIKFDGHFHGFHDYVMWNYGGYSPPTARQKRRATP